MKLNNFFKLAIAIIISELAGIIGSVFTASAITGWYAGLEKPALNPPSWVFGFVWTILYFLIGISLFLVWKNNWEIRNPILESRRKAWNVFSERLWMGDLQKVNVIAIFVVQYILNIAWSYLFFGLRLSGLAFFGLLALWLAIIWTIANFYRISKTAAYLLLPYILWVSFAGYLNYSIWQLNPSVNLGQVVCIQDAKPCSDGSYVGRSGPNCEFAMCPKENLIRVFSPRPNEEISSPLLITGEARGNWFFEASFPVVLVDWDGRIIAQYYAQAKGEWMTADFVSFESVLEFESPVFPEADINHFSRRGALILQKDNPSGLPEHDDALEIPISFK